LVNNFGWFSTNRGHFWKKPAAKIIEINIPGKSTERIDAI
jgi:hypothetical protein